MYTASVERTFEAAHHNGPPGHRCNNNHGHSWRIVLEFTYSTSDLDQYGWGPDFGLAKRMLEELVAGPLDHGDLNDVLDFPSAENLAEWAYHRIEPYALDAFHITPLAVTIYEGSGNGVRYSKS